MTFYALAFPNTSIHNLAWIKEIRQQHDPHFELVAPHFTLVFGVEMDPENLETHLQKTVGSFGTFQFILRSAIVVKDSFSSNYQVFLVPDEGFSPLVKLHDALYTAVLAPALRLDIPYIPHITIAASPDARKMKKLADSLNVQDFCIEGEIEQVDLVQLEGEALVTLKSFKLHH